KEKPHKPKTRKTDDDSWKKYRKSREAKTQCPERSLSDEMESALRSAADMERRKKAAEEKCVCSKCFTFVELASSNYFVVLLGNTEPWKRKLNSE
ncbi:hypothetical protein TELCIR_06978, partial [Teladorsagia circumcincta]